VIAEIWFVLLLAIVHAVWTIYQLLRETESRFGKTHALRLSQSPLLNGLWNRFSLKTAMALLGIILAILTAILAIVLGKVVAGLLQWVTDKPADESYGLLFTVGLLVGMWALVAKKNHQSLHLMQKGDLWFERNVLCRRLEPVEGPKSRSKTRRG